MIDTNVLLDVLVEREPFFQDSKAVLDLCESGQVEGFFSASSVTDLFYLVHRHLHNTELTYQALGTALGFVNVLPVTAKDVLTAYLRRAPDFEGCLLAVCAETNNCDAIVTRNTKHFITLGFPLYQPKELLALF